MKRSDWAWVLCVSSVILMACFVSQSERSPEWIDYGACFALGATGNIGFAFDIGLANDDGMNVAGSRRDGFLDGYAFFEKHIYGRPESAH